MKPLAAASLAACLLACARPGAPPAVVHRAVVGPALERLGAEVASARAAAAGGERGPDLELEHARGLAHMLAHAGPRTRELPLEEVELAGEAAVAPLGVLARTPDLDASERAAAIELLGRAGGERAAEVLLELAASDPEPWVRSHAAWHLGATGIDRCVPDLVLRLKYESDAGVVVWLCRALARLGSFAGVPVLRDLRDDPDRDPELRALAGAELENLARELELASGDALVRTREIADPDSTLPVPEPSAALRLEVWRRIAQLSGEHFQLRGVDDARFVLARLEAWAAGPLSEVLREDDVWLRVHAAQCLGRMGPRAMAAGPALVEALADPTLAPEAARALGELDWPPAGPHLLRLVDARWPHEQRVAAVRSLGRLGVAEALPRLAGLLGASEPADLRLTAAEALVEMGAGDRAARALLAFLADPTADRAAAEEALGRWLSARTDQPARALLERWLELGRSRTYPAPTAEEVEARMRARGRLLEAALPELVG